MIRCLVASLSLAWLVLAWGPAACAAQPPRPPDGPGDGPARALERVRALTGPDDVLRVRGPFGEFSGWSSQRDGSGLAGLRRDARFDPVRSAPPALIPWEQVTSLEKRGNSSGSFAVVGAIVLGVAGAGLGGFSSWGSVMANGGGPGEVAGGAVLGALTGGIAGAVLGAVVGAPVRRWHRVYRADAGR